MASIPQDLVGRELYARDGQKIGEIKEAVYGGDCVVVRKSLFSKLVVPVRAIESSGDRLILPFSSEYLDHAPKVDPKYELSPKDRAYLDAFYTRHAA